MCSLRLHGRLKKLKQKLGATQLVLIRDQSGNATVLTIGLMVVVLMVVGLMVAVTGVEIERNRVQFVADGAALFAATSVDEEALYGVSGAELVHRDFAGRLIPTDAGARKKAQDFVDKYPAEFRRIDSLRVVDSHVMADGRVHVTLEARVHPPLVEWFSRTAKMPVTIVVSSEAHAH